MGIGIRIELKLELEISMMPVMLLRNSFDHVRAN